MTHDYQAALDAIKKVDRDWYMTDFDTRGEALGACADQYFETIRKALELAIALQPKPISEAPKDGTGFYGLIDGELEHCRVKYNELYVLNNGDYNDGGYGRDYKCGEEEYSMPTHFYDISALPKPEEKTK